MKNQPKKIDLSGLKAEKKKMTTTSKGKAAKSGSKKVVASVKAKIKK